MTMQTCPLCDHYDNYEIVCDGKTYYRCRECRLVFLDPEFHLDSAAEKAVYDQHDNRIDDPDYRAFLSRALQEVTARIEAPARGLDFGCGPGPALMVMAEEAGYSMAGYDKFYCPDKGVLVGQYDFVLCTEVAEHLAYPMLELDRLYRLLDPGGILVIQTKRVLDDERFRNWFYRNDPTHITFFAEQTMEYLAIQWDCAVSLPADDIAVFERIY